MKLTLRVLTGGACLVFLVGPLSAATVQELEAEVIQLKTQLQEAESELSRARAEAETQSMALAEGERRAAAANAGFEIGPLRIGGAVRVNYVYGSYENLGNGPNRGGHGGNVELDTFRINMALNYQQLIGKLEYRWYPAGTGKNYSFLHTGWLGYQFDEDSHIEVGVNRVPFGAGPYGISQSWFFDQSYYVGLSDDPDLGFKYRTKVDNWSLDFGYYPRSEPSFSGRSVDSARYGYDAVRWNESIDENGTVVFGGSRNGYREKDQFNVRAIYAWKLDQGQVDIGTSLQYGKLDGSNIDDGDHWAASAHAVYKHGKLTFGSQLSRYEFDVDEDNPWNSDELIPMGAYDFAWPAATEAWVPAVSLSYRINTDSIPWLDYALPYVEWSSIIKDGGDFDDSQLFILGSAWSRGGWYIYSDLAYSDGNYFVGNKGDDYSRVDGVGDFGVSGNDKWHYRFNLNLGYYY